MIKEVPKRRGRFATTQWSLVRLAGDEKGSRSREALQDLCSNYWFPLYSFARSRGFADDVARDLTQGFFAFLLEKRSLQAADESRGRFRTFLITAFKNYITNLWHKEHAAKRGGEVTFIPLEPGPEDERRPIEPVEGQTPEQIYDREWAHTVLENVLAELESEAASRGGRERFLALRGLLTGEGQGEGYRAVGDRLGLSETAVKVAVYRLRQRFGVLLREAIGATVASDEEIESEIRYLFEALAN